MNYHLINFVLLVIVNVVLALTASSYVDCKDLVPDEFLDLAIEPQYSISPVFAPHQNTHPMLQRSLEIFYLGGVNLLTAIIRC